MQREAWTEKNITMGPECNARLTEQDRQRTGQRENNITVGPECKARLTEQDRQRTGQTENNVTVGPECNARLMEQNRQRTILPWVQKESRDGSSCAEQRGEDRRETRQKARTCHNYLLWPS